MRVHLGSLLLGGLLVAGGFPLAQAPSWLRPAHAGASTHSDGYLVTSDDADRSKPDPDIVAAAIAALGATKSTCVMVGDTPYDGAAARRAGARFIGVTTGYHDERALRAAGAERVFPDVGALHAKLALLLGG